MARAMVAPACMLLLSTAPPAAASDPSSAPASTSIKSVEEEAGMQQVTGGKARESSGAARSIMFMVADDLGFNDVSFHGSAQIPTPALDELAATGLVLDNYHAMPVCSPTRASLLSGRHAIHHGIYMPFSQGARDLKTQPVEPCAAVLPTPAHCATPCSPAPAACALQPAPCSLHPALCYWQAAHCGST